MKIENIYLLSNAPRILVIVQTYLNTTKFRRQRGRAVSASDSQSGGTGFESRSGHLLDLCSVVPSSNFSATLVNSQLVAFCQFGVFNPVMLYLNYLFLIFEWSACKLAD